jgi:hypothetical protein
MAGSCRMHFMNKERVFHGCEKKDRESGEAKSCAS